MLLSAVKLDFQHINRLSTDDFQLRELSKCM